jgi:hypothetical protein
MPTLSKVAQQARQDGAKVQMIAIWYMYAELDNRLGMHKLLQHT